MPSGSEPLPASDTVEYWHLLAEVLKLVWRDRLRYLADPRFAPVPQERLLDPGYNAGRVAALRDFPHSVHAPVPALEAGAVGLSSGLYYATARGAPTSEVIALASVVGRAGGLYATHLRDEGLRVIEAMNEAFARMHGCTAGELRGRPMTELLAPESLAGIAERLPEAAKHMSSKAPVTASRAWSRSERPRLAARSIARRYLTTPSGASIRPSPGCVTRRSTNTPVPE